MKKLATEKQIKFFLSLYPVWKNKLKQEYRFYNDDAVTDYINNVHRHILDEKPVEMKHISVAIDDMKKDIK